MFSMSINHNVYIFTDRYVSDLNDDIQQVRADQTAYYHYSQNNIYIKMADEIMRVLVALQTLLWGRDRR